MSTVKIADVLGIVGNLGLILGLLLVGYQIKQTNDLARAQMMSDGFVTTLTVDLALIGEQGPQVHPKADYPSNELSDEEILVLERVFRAKLGAHMRLARLREVGLSQTSETFQTQDLAYELNSAFGRMYWDISKEAIGLTPSFIEQVDQSLAELAELAPIDYYRSELLKRERQ